MTNAYVSLRKENHRAWGISTAYPTLSEGDLKLVISGDRQLEEHGYDHALIKFPEGVTPDSKLWNSYALGVEVAYQSAYSSGLLQDPNARQILHKVYEGEGCTVYILPIPFSKEHAITFIEYTPTGTYWETIIEFRDEGDDASAKRVAYAIHHVKDSSLAVVEGRESFATKTVEEMAALHNAELINKGGDFSELKRLYESN